jgi:hypothetical protein
VPFHQLGDDTISVTTGLGMPKKAADARRNPRVSLLFSDPTGSGIHDPSMVLVQGIATVDDADLDQNRARYERDSATKPTGPTEQAPGGTAFDWYYTRLYIEVRPLRVYVWRKGDLGAEPDVYELAPDPDPEDLPPTPPRPPGRPPHWNRRLEHLGRRHDTAVLSFVETDGYPFAIRVPVDAGRRAKVVRIDAEPHGVRLLPGPACLTAHDHHEMLHWTRNFQVRGELLQDRDGWLITPQRVLTGFELPPSGAVTRAVLNLGKIRRFRKTAKRERRRRGSGSGRPTG